VPGSSAWKSWTATALERIDAHGQRRSLLRFDASGPAGTLGCDDVVSFASNDYLGLSSHPAALAAAHAALDRWGTGATSSRLIVGNRPCHADLEAALADWKSTDRALVFPTGFAANLGVLGVFGGPNVTVLSDELNHASIIDGCRLSRSNVVVYRHNDLEHLADLLTRAEGRSIVVTDSVFSMDGDVAPVTEVAELCASHAALLVVDEAHAVLGPHVADVPGLDVLRVGTLSKTLGSLGGWVAGTAPMIDLLVNRARPFIFTTGLAPADTAAATAALQVLRSTQGDRLLARLRGVIDRIAPGHPSPIVPIVLGNEQRALDVASRLLDQGLLVPAIRPPTVPPGTSRLRISLSAAHTDAMIDRLTARLSELQLMPGSS
jgi:8-amino-7-oxononanoate synthase